MSPSSSPSPWAAQAVSSSSKSLRDRSKCVPRHQAANCVPRGPRSGSHSSLVRQASSRYAKRVTRSRCARQPRPGGCRSRRRSPSARHHALTPGKVGTARRSRSETGGKRADTTPCLSTRDGVALRRDSYAGSGIGARSKAGRPRGWCSAARQPAWPVDGHARSLGGHRSFRCA
jgi:hypothetical protein